MRPGSIANKCWASQSCPLSAHAQDLEPRAYSNSPTGLSFAIAGYAYAKGTVLTDPSLPLDNVSNESHVGVFAYATTLNVFGKSAKFDMIVPYASLAAKGLVLGLARGALCHGLCGPGIPLLDELHSGARADGGRVSRIIDRISFSARACASLRRSANTTTTSS
jgi:hypothetical protein